MAHCRIRVRAHGTEQHTVTDSFPLRCWCTFTLDSRTSFAIHTTLIKLTANQLTDSCVRRIYAKNQNSNFPPNKSRNTWIYLRKKLPACNCVSSRFSHVNINANQDVFFVLILPSVLCGYAPYNAQSSKRIKNRAREKIIFFSACWLSGAPLTCRCRTCCHQ